MSVTSFEFINFILFLFITIIASLQKLRNVILITTLSFKSEILQLILRESNQADCSATRIKANSEHAGLWIRS